MMRQTYAIHLMNTRKKPHGIPFCAILSLASSWRVQRRVRAGQRRKDRLNEQVVSTLEALWTKRGAEIIDQLAAEKPEVVASLIARLIPQELATQAITGDDQDKVQQNQDVTIRVVTDQRQDVLPPREVEGELLLDDTTTH